MIAFSRQHQEEKLTKEQEDGIRQLTEDEVDLEEKLQQLYELDRELQDQSFGVTSLQEDRVSVGDGWRRGRCIRMMGGGRGRCIGILL